MTSLFIYPDLDGPIFFRVVENLIKSIAILSKVGKKESRPSPAMIWSIENDCLVLCYLWRAHRTEKSDTSDSPLICQIFKSQNLIS
jgi:hypothetical protein